MTQDNWDGRWGSSTRDGDLKESLPLSSDLEFPKGGCWVSPIRPGDPEGREPWKPLTTGD